MLTDEEKRKKERRNRRFAQGELGALLRLFSSLGLAVATGIVLFFLLGLWLNRWLEGMGVQTYGLPRIASVLGGVAISIYWAYLRIGKHLDDYGDDAPEDAE